MSDEAEKFILGDTAISAAEEHSGGQRGLFGRKRRRRAPLTHCENCGTQLSGHYCAQCGQPAIDYRRSFRHVVGDLLDSFLNWDSKFIHTIGLLIARPWRLTNEFLAGRRVRYLHPARLYLLASILFFFAVTYWAKSLHVPAGNLPPEVKAEIAADLQKENLTPEQLTKVQKALDLTNMSPAAAAKMAKKLKEKDEKRKAKGMPAASTTPATSAMPLTSPTPAPSATPENSPAEESTPDSEKEKDSKPDNPFFDVTNDSKPPKNEFEKWIQDRAKEKFGEHGTKAQLFFITLISNLPYMMLCCIPLFAFVLKILYIRKKVFYIDHLVYALHIHTFVYLSVMLIGLVIMGLNRSMPGTLAGWIIGLLWTAFAVQIFLSIRRVYKQGWFFSIFKFLVGGFVYLMVLSVALAVTFFITLALP